MISLPSTQEAEKFMQNYLRLIQRLNGRHSGNFAEESREEYRDVEQFLRKKGLIHPIVWSYRRTNGEFRKLSPNFGYNNITQDNFKEFLLGIKPCFRNYFIDFLIAYFELTSSPSGYESQRNHSLRSFLPYRVNSKEYHYVTLHVVPQWRSQRITELYFVLIPLKKYDEEIISMCALTHRKKDLALTKEIRRLTQVEKILTKEQNEVFECILKGLTSREIALALNKKHDNILKFNVRITARLSTFFEMGFESVKEAADYYRNCFQRS